MRKEVEALRTEVKQLKDEVAELRKKILLVLDDNRNRDGFLRQVLVELGNAILITGQSNPQLEHYAKIRRLVLGFQLGDPMNWRTEAPSCYQETQGSNSLPLGK